MSSFFTNAWRRGLLALVLPLAMALAHPIANSAHADTVTDWNAIMQTTVSTPPTKFVTLIDSPPGAAFGGSWTYEIQPVPEGSRVTITEDGWVANPIFRFLSRFVFGHHGTQVSYLTALSRKYGETVQPVRQ